jgi:hypothetical protein
LKRRRCFPSVSFGLVLAAGFLHAALAVAATPSPTTTELTISTGNSVAGRVLVTLTASVSASGNPVSPGSVLFCNAQAAYCEDLNILGQAQLTASGSASLNLILPIGSHQIRAEFKGTSSHAPSSSPTESVTVAGKYPTITTFTAVPSPATYAIQGKVISGGLPAQTGTLNFPDGSNHLIPLVTSPVGPPTFQFTALAALPGTTALTSGAVADLNRDGRLDQLAYDNVNNNVVVLFGNGDGTFVAGPVIPVGRHPDAIAVGDFNNDDILDFAVANQDDNNVYVFLGNGDGTFSAPAAIAVGNTPNYISAGDFNNDGNADLVVSSSAGSSIWIGNGKGGFTLSTAPALPQAFSSIRVADLNGDGNADLVYSIQSSIHVSLGKGDGTFTTAAAPSVPCGNACVDAVVADFNGDGEPDLAVASIGNFTNGSGNVSFMTGLGDGTFGAPTAFSYVFVTSLSVGDFLGDGKVDVFESNLLNYQGELLLDYFVILQGNGDGTFVEFGSLSGTVAAIGDFNSDGMTDLALSTPTAISLASWQTTVADSRATVTGSLGIHNVFANYEGDATHAASASAALGLQGPKAATTTTLQASPTPIAPGQAMQLVATVSPSLAGQDRATGTITFSNGPNTLGVVPVSDGRAVFSTTVLPIGSNISLTAHYSGNSDFIASTSLPIYLTTRGALRPGSTIALGVSPASTAPQGTVVTLSAKVFDAGQPLTIGLVTFYGSTSAHPGKTILGQAQLTPAGVATMKFKPPLGSLAFQAIYQGTNSHAGCASTWQALTVTGKLATSTLISANPPNYSAAVTAYGLLPASGQVTFADATNSNLAFATAPLIPVNTLTTQYSLTPAPSPSVVNGQLALATADFNGDGILDIATFTSSGFSILLGNPDGTFTQKFTTNVAGYLPSLAVADFNGDGIPDVAVLQVGDPHGSIFVFLGRGDGTLTSQPTLVVGEWSASLVSGDFNGDGIPDLIATNLDDTTNVLLGNGDGTFRAVPSPNLGSSAVGTAIVADFNGDGIPDVATGVYGDGVILLLGNGDGTFVTRFLPFYTQVAPLTLAEADFNGDGIPDLLLTGALQGLTLLLGNGDATFATYKLLGGLPDDNVTSITGDLNGDGIPDLVIQDWSNSELDILLGKGDGTFVQGPDLPLPTPGIEGSAGIAIGDFNGDGLPDLLAVSGFGAPAMYEWLSAVTQTSLATAKNVTPPGTGTQQVYAIYPGDATHTSSVSATVPVASAAPARPQQ